MMKLRGGVDAAENVLLGVLVRIGDGRSHYWVVMGEGGVLRLKSGVCGCLDGLRKTRLKLHRLY
jgi:hypothetical protein